MSQNYTNPKSEPLTGVQTRLYDANEIFYSSSFGHQIININREPQHMPILKRFDDLMYQYDSENGPHLVLSNDSKQFILRLNPNHIFYTLNIDPQQKLSQEQYIEKFNSEKRANCEYLINSIYNIGFETPLTVQLLAIPPLVQGCDVIMQSKSGTGKTIAFLVGTLFNFDHKNPALQYVFFINTREIADQTFKHIMNLFPDAKVIKCVGQGNGARRTTQTMASKPQTPLTRPAISSAQMMVATTGAFGDYVMKRKWASLRELKAIVVDEFDTFCDDKNKHSGNVEVKTTFDHLADVIDAAPKTCQRVFFSATVDKKSFHNANAFLRSDDETDPLLEHEHAFICLNPENDCTLGCIDQFYIKLEAVDKPLVVTDILNDCEIAQCIVFVNTVRSANELKAHLDSQAIPFPAGIIHRDVPDRESVYNDFVNKKIRLLISTDILARGLDNDLISLVINYDVPNDFATYVHRVGRSGRGNKKGKAITFIVVDNYNDESSNIDFINKNSQFGQMKELTGTDNV